MRSGGVKVSAVAMIAAVALLAPSAAPAALTCGSQITQDRKLHADLDCTGYGDPALTIEADGVKLDLNGHTITGPDSTPGIFAADRRKDVRIKNGAISGYNHAIEMLAGGRDLTVSDLELSVAESNSMGVYIGEFNHVRMDHLRIRDANYGIFAFDNKDVVVRNSRIRAGTATGQTIGINIGGNVNHTGSLDHVKVTKATYGFYVYGPTTGFEIIDNVANGGGFAGFNIGNGTAPRAYTINDNTANDNDQYGFFAGKRVRHSAGNRASGNGVEDCHKVKCV
jgi:Right handed beta helix region